MGINPLAEEIQIATKQTEGAEMVVVGTVSARRYPGQVQLVQALGKSLVGADL